VDVGVCTITHRTAELEESGTERTSSNRVAPAAAAGRNHHPHHATEGPRIRPQRGAASFVGRGNAQVRVVGAGHVVGAHVVLCGRRSMPAQRDCRLLPHNVQRGRGGSSIAHRYRRRYLYLAYIHRIHRIRIRVFRVCL